MPDCDRKSQYTLNDCPVKLGQNVMIQAKFLQLTHKIHALLGLFGDQFSVFVPSERVR